MTVAEQTAADTKVNLNGTLTRLWPYVPGLYGRDTLYRIWRAMEDDGSTHKAFWDSGVDSSLAADLGSFAKSFHDTTTKVMFMVESAETWTLVGAIWFTMIAQGHQATASIWMSKAARGAITREASQLALDYAFSAWNLHQVWCQTPWPEARALAMRLGFSHAAVLPDYCWYDGQLLTVQVYRLTKERWHGRQRTR